MSGHIKHFVKDPSWSLLLQLLDFGAELLPGAILQTKTASELCVQNGLARFRGSYDLNDVAYAVEVFGQVCGIILQEEARDGLEAAPKDKVKSAPVAHLDQKHRKERKRAAHFKAEFGHRRWGCAPFNLLISCLSPPTHSQQAKPGTSLLYTSAQNEHAYLETGHTAQSCLIPLACGSTRLQRYGAEASCVRFRAV